MSTAVLLALAVLAGTLAYAWWAGYAIAGGLHPLWIAVGVPPSVCGLFTSISGYSSESMTSASNAYGLNQGPMIAHSATRPRTEAMRSPG